MIDGSKYRSLLLLLVLIIGSGSTICAQKSDLELLREVSFSLPRGDREVPYGIEPGQRSLSPIYHLTSSALWVWENYIAAEVCAPGGYSDTNTHYFKSLTKEYGALSAFFLSFDRVVRNTKIGRVSSPKNKHGLITDDPKRYRQ